MEVTVFLYVNSVKIYQFIAKYSEIKPYPMCLGNILKGFTVNNMKRTTLNEHIYDFSVDYNTIDVSEIVDFHKYLMKKHNIQ